MAAVSRPPVPSVRVCAAIGLLLAALAAGCAPLQHSIAPYDRDAAQARQLEARAADACGRQRTDGALPTYPFTTDGCTLWPDAPWLECCIVHDMAYWCGGPAEQRALADRSLRECVSATGHGTTAAWMHFGVRIYGGPLWPFPWRWGYGWDWPGR